MLALALQFWGLIQDREALREGLIRLHVVANSDSREDQQVKLQVRDAVLESIREALTDATEPEAARAYLRENLPKIQQAANNVLQALGREPDARVSLKEEVFDRRDYETFSLPAGIYESLRVEIGQAEGKNWWCVAFPSLCVPATTESFAEAAQAAGMDPVLTGTLEGRGEYELRFFLLDWLGKLEGRLFGKK